MMGGTLFSPEGSWFMKDPEIKQWIIMGRANFMMGGTLFSPEGS